MLSVNNVSRDCLPQLCVLNYNPCLGIQVYRAKLTQEDGTVLDVAIKVIHPRVQVDKASGDADLDVDPCDCSAAIPVCICFPSPLWFPQLFFRSVWLLTMSIFCAFSRGG